MTLRQFDDAMHQALRMHLDERYDRAVDAHFAAVGGDALTKHLNALKKR